MRVYQVKNRRLQLQHEQVSHLQITMEAHFDEPAPEPLHVQKETFDQNARNCLRCAKAAVVSHVAQRVTVTYSTYLSLSVLGVKQA